MDKDYLVLKRASASRSSGEWSDDDYDVLAGGVVVGRIMKVLGQTVVSTGAYVVQGGTKAPAARYIWSLYFRLERVIYDPGLSSSGSRHESDPQTSRQACRRDRRQSPHP